MNEIERKLRAMLREMTELVEAYERHYDADFAWAKDMADAAREVGFKNGYELGLKDGMKLGGVRK